MIIVYYLEGCPYSEECIKVLDKHKLKYKIVSTDQAGKENFKKKHGITTFPLITIKKGKKETIIGGFTDLIYLIDLCKDIRSKK